MWYSGSMVFPPNAAICDVAHNESLNPDEPAVWGAWGLCEEACEEAIVDVVFHASVRRIQVLISRRTTQETKLGSSQKG